MTFTIRTSTKVRPA